MNSIESAKTMKNTIKVLLIDDNEDFRVALKHLLTPNFEVIEAGNGEHALEMLTTEFPDMAIVDLDMPKMNGIEFSRRAKRENPGMPIIMVTAYSQFYSSKEVIAAGIDAFLQKPIEGEKLMEVINQLQQTPSKKS